MDQLVSLGFLLVIDSSLNEFFLQDVLFIFILNLLFTVLVLHNVFYSQFIEFILLGTL